MLSVIVSFFIAFLYFLTIFFIGILINSVSYYWLFHFYGDNIAFKTAFKVSFYHFWRGMIIVFSLNKYMFSQLSYQEILEMDKNGKKGKNEKY